MVLNKSIYNSGNGSSVEMQYNFAKDIKNKEQKIMNYYRNINNDSIQKINTKLQKFTKRTRKNILHQTINEKEVIIDDKKKTKIATYSQDSTNTKPSNYVNMD